MGVYSRVGVDILKVETRLYSCLAHIYIVSVSVLRRISKQLARLCCSLQARSGRSDQLGVSPRDGIAHDRRF